MPGSLLYDFGDALRFAGNRTAEDDPDLSRVVFDLDRYEEYVSGFLAGVGDAITQEEKAMLPLSVGLEGEYGLNGINCGAPCVVGRRGIERIVELPLTAPEREALLASAAVLEKHTRLANQILAGL